MALSIKLSTSGVAVEHQPPPVVTGTDFPFVCVLLRALVFLPRKYERAQKRNIIEGAKYSALHRSRGDDTTDTSAAANQRYNRSTGDDGLCGSHGVCVCMCARQVVHAIMFPFPVQFWTKHYVAQPYQFAEQFSSSNRSSLESVMTIRLSIQRQQREIQVNHIPKGILVCNMD